MLGEGEERKQQRRSQLERRGSGDLHRLQARHCDLKNKNEKLSKASSWNGGIYLSRRLTFELEWLLSLDVGSPADRGQGWTRP